MLLTISDNLDVFYYFSLLESVHIKFYTTPVNIKNGDKASAIREILQEAKSAKIILTRKEPKL